MRDFNELPERKIKKKKKVSRSGSSCIWTYLISTSDYTVERHLNFFSRANIRLPAASSV